MEVKMFYKVRYQYTIGYEGGELITAAGSLITAAESEYEARNKVVDYKSPLTPQGIMQIIDVSILGEGII